MHTQEKLIRHTIEVGGKILELETGRFAQQSNAAVLGRYGDTMILATVVSGGLREDLDYFPLSVEYQEKLYAGGRIKGSRWVKREGRPNDDAILNARLVDRSIRPLFPENFTAETQVILTVLSVDAENDPDILGIITTSAALAISDIPWEGPLAAVRIGFVPKGKNDGTKTSQIGQEEKTEAKNPTNLAKDHSTEEGDFMINPTYLEREYSDLDLVVSATSDAVVMVEAGSNEISEPTLIKAFAVSQSEIKRIIEGINKLTELVGKKKQAIPKKKEDPQVMKAVAKHAKDIIKTSTQPETQEKEANLDTLVQAITETEPQLNKNRVKQELFNLLKQKTRDTILKSGKRSDGRKTDQIRPITCEVGILPRTHGSAMFQRGATQALTITTLAAPSLEQWIETMEGEGTKRYMHHYFMPPFSLGEVGRLGWPSRREIGHGALAERALEPMIPKNEEFPYTIRVVSEILSSNGSTSMASVCGSTLSLMDAGVPLKKPVAGIAMGLVYEGTQQDKKKNYAILSDIQGIEDHIGDMDFKVAGTKDGITALQMDVKIKGVSTKLLREALEQARQGRLFILEKMLAVLPAPRAQLSKYAPRVEVLKISTEQIGDIIGPGGKMIRQIIAETGASVDVEDDGTVTVSGTDPAGIQKAVSWIEGLTRKVQVGEEFEGVVKRIQPFGAFVEILPGKEGLVHVSKMSQDYVQDPSQLVSIGDKLKVKVAEIDELGRINLSIPGIERKHDASPGAKWQQPRGRQFARPRFRSQRR